MYFNEPGEKEINLLPLVVHGAAEHTERYRCDRPSGLGTCGEVSLCTGGKGRFFDSFGKEHVIEQGEYFILRRRLRTATSLWKIPGT